MKAAFRVSALFCFSLLVSISIAADLPAPPRHDFPKVGSYEVLCGDFHMHTVYSDGKFTVKERVEESSKLGYDVIAITDHGKTNGYRMAKSVGERLGLVVLRGFETGVKGNEHMNAIGVSDAYKPLNPHNWAEQPGQNTVYYRDEMPKIASREGIIIYNHPHVGYREPVTWGVEQGYVVGIEVKNDVVANGWNTVKSHGTDCYPEAFDFALKHNLAIFANTDVHAARPNPCARTLMLVKSRSAEGVMEAIRARRTAAWFNGMIWGREDLLTELVKAAVAAKSESGKVIFTNLGPVALQGTIDGSANSSFKLPAYGSVTVDGVSGKPMSVTWTNLWTSPKTNLKITFS